MEKQQIFYLVGMKGDVQLVKEFEEEYLDIVIGYLDPKVFYFFIEKMFAVGIFNKGEDLDVVWEIIE